MWQEKDKQLYKKFEFKDFDEAFSFMQAVAEVASSMDHHPTWTNSYNKVEIWLSSHTEAKVTDKDVELSKRIDRIFETMHNKENMSINEAKLYTDGGARGNPGPAACAFVICKMDDTVVKKYGFYAGETTNNQAEYRALLAGLEEAGKQGIKRLYVFMDSELIIKQINGEYKVKNAELLPHYQNAKALSDEFQEISFTHVPRALNKIADAEVNRVLDERQKA